MDMTTNISFVWPATGINITTGVITIARGLSIMKYTSEKKKSSKLSNDYDTVMLLPYMAKRCVVLGPGCVTPRA